MKSMSDENGVVGYGLIIISVVCECLGHKSYPSPRDPTGSSTCVAGVVSILSADMKALEIRKMVS